MTMREFVTDLFNACRETPEKMDIEAARYDVNNFMREAEDSPECWEVPEDITPEEYMHLWNELVEEQERAAAAEEL